jgi:hypothetical protein
MEKKTKIGLGIGGGAALVAAAAGIALARPNHGPEGADVNGDGQITAQEIAATARARFAEADSNRDGKLTGDEIPRRHGRHGGRRHGPGPDENGPPPPAAGPGEPAGPAVATVPPRPPRMDSDGDGAVTLREYYDGLRQRLGRADANGDGTISADELAAAHRHRHERG